MNEREQNELTEAGGLLSAGNPEDAFELLKGMLRHSSPEFLELDAWRVHEMIGACFHDMADAEGVVQAYLEAAQCDRYLRSQRSHFSNYLFALHYLPGLSDEWLREQHFLYGELYRDAEPLPPGHRKAGGKVRIGYLAPDFLEQSAARFYEALLTQYDRDRFEIYCYELSGKRDGFRDRLKESVSVFRNLGEVSFEEAALCIREDETDVLFDLGGHSAGGETLQIMGYRPVPVQISGIGWFDTTGLPMMDYFLTDAYLVPEEKELQFSECLLRLSSAFAFLPGADMKAAVPGERSRDSSFVFGCFNNFMKLNSEVLEVFRRILLELPEARLILQDTTGLQSRRKHTELRVREAGLPMDRVEVRAGRNDYLSCYDETDVMLDPWPYPGGGMTCTALYMGVPVISLAGSRHGSRFGVSLLNGAGFPEFAADSPGAYVDKAVRLMRNGKRRAQLRKTLREQMEHSQLLDTAGWVREMEERFLDLAGRQRF